MSPSSAFLREISRQVALAQREIDIAHAHGDETDIVLARGRLVELDELTRRATDDMILATPSWP